jgi:hypothetical protein
VDYSSLAAEVPEIRAELEQLQNVVFAASALVFMTLVDPKPDSQDQVSRLLITKAEKSDLEGTLAIILEGQPNEGDHDPYVSAAMVIRDDLVKKGTSVQTSLGSSQSIPPGLDRSQAAPTCRHL